VKIQKLKVDLNAYIGSCFERALWLRDMGGRESLRRPRIFGITYTQLGDHWVGLCHYIRFRRFSRQAHKLSVPTSERMSLLYRIASILGVESELEFTGAKPELEVAVHPARNGRTLVIPNSANDHRAHIAYQFDGKSHAHLNPTAEEVAGFLGCFDCSQLRPVGLPSTLEQSAKILVGAKLFVGVSSGMSHLAASAGTPSLIYAKNGGGVNEYKRLKLWNPYSNTRFFSSAEELKKQL
jgi:hypothetical protein